MTGAGSALRRAIVERLVAEDARVGVLEIDPAKAGALQRDLGDRAEVVVGDATSFADGGMGAWGRREQDAAAAAASDE